MSADEQLDTEKLDRQGRALAQVFYWLIVAFFAIIAVIGTVMAAQKRGLFGTPAIFIGFVTIVLWILVGAMAWIGIRRRPPAV